MLIKNETMTPAAVSAAVTSAALTRLPALPANEREAAFKKAVALLEKQFEGLNVAKLGKKIGLRVPCISTNLPTFDETALTSGGIPKGRIVEVFGPESSGKTSVCLHFIGEAQKQGGLAAFIDAEHALDPAYAKKLGVDVENLVVSQPDYGEQALEIALGLIESRAFDIIVIDSVSALVPRAELEGDVGDSHMGLQARLMSQAMRKLVGAVYKTGTILIFINQIREKVGVVFGNPETTTGGRALKFFASVRVEVRRIANSKGGQIKDGDTHVGHKIRFKIVKNKVGPPFREAEADLIYASGFDTRQNWIDYAASLGIVELGTWCKITGDDKKYRSYDLTKDEVFATIKQRAIAERDKQLAVAQTQADAPAINS